MKNIFYAKSNWDTRTVKTAITKNYGDYMEITDTVAFQTNYNGGFAKYQIELTPTVTESNARLIFYVGERQGWIKLDQVKLWPKQATKVSDTTPEFSAIYDDPNSGDYATDYQIQVIPYDGDWDSPLWDSGKTSLSSNVLEGNRTADISYAGTPLGLNGMKYKWRIKLWDDEDNEGEWTNGNDFFVMAGKRIQDLTYSYDDVGNITQIVDDSETNTKKQAVYAYDDLYRLTSATITNSATQQDYTQTYTYDSLGNFTNRSDAGDYEYNGNQGTNYANPHAPTRLNDAYDIAYDHNGNFTTLSYQQWTVQSLTWDYNNRMVASSGTNDPADYVYDHEGNRIVKDVDSGSVVTVSPNKYYDKKVEGENETITENIYAGNQLVLTITNDGTNVNDYYVHSDNLGSSSVMTKGDGTTEQVIDYYPYGNLRFNERSDPQNGSFDQEKKFTGKKLDSDASGLQYFGARYYSGEVGRFVSEDPTLINFDEKDQERLLVDPQLLNFYAYGRNNPLKYLDPDGNTPREATLTICQGVKSGGEFSFGVVAGTVKGITGVALGTVNAALHPIDTAKSAVSFELGALAGGYSLSKSLISNPQQLMSDIKSDLKTYQSGLSKMSSYDKGEMVGFAVGTVAATYAGSKAGGKLGEKGTQYKIGTKSASVDITHYQNAGGFGINLKVGEYRAGLDWHQFNIGNNTVNLPHFDLKVGDTKVISHFPWGENK